MSEELTKTLTAAISSMKENEQLVLSLYYEKNLKMKDIADVMEITPPRVSQIHARAVHLLIVLHAYAQMLCHLRVCGQIPCGIIELCHGLFYTLSALAHSSRHPVLLSCQISADAHI